MIVNGVSLRYDKLAHAKTVCTRVDTRLEERRDRILSVLYLIEYRCIYMVY